MRKIVLLLLILLVVLTACAPQQPKPQLPVETTTPTVETTQPQPEEKPLKNVDRYPLETDTSLYAVSGLEGAAEADNWLLFEEITGIDIHWQYMKGEATKALRDSDVLPDLFFQTSGLSLTDIHKMGASGKVIDFREYLEQMPNLSARLEEHPQLFSVVADPEGHIYTLPCIKQTTNFISNVMFIRTDMATEAGWTVLPETVEAFLVMCQDLQETYADLEGYYPIIDAYTAYNGSYANVFFPAFGELMLTEIAPNSEKTQMIAGFSTEQYKRYLEFMASLYASGYIDPTSFAGDTVHEKKQMMDGLATMGSNDTALEQVLYNMECTDFQVLPPMGSSQLETQARWAKPGIYWADTYMISTTCADISAALAFLDAMYADETDPLNEAGTIWGISVWLGEIGKNITWNVAEGSYEIQGDPAYDMSTSSNSWLYIWGSNRALYMKWEYYDEHRPATQKKAEAYRTFLKPVSVDVAYSNTLPLYIQEQETLDALLPGIEQYVNEMSMDFITGEANLDTQWETYLLELEQLGLSRLLELYQTALERCQKNGPR